MNWMTILLAPMLQMAPPTDTTISITMPYESLNGSYTIVWAAQEEKAFDLTAYNYTLTLDEAAGTFQGQACNLLRGSFSATMAKTIRFEPIGATRKFCPPDQGGPAVVHALQTCNSFRFEGDVLLLLLDEKPVLKLRRAAAADSPIDPGLEVVSTMMSSSYTITGVAAPEQWVNIDSGRATFIYDAEAGRVSGKAVCNNYFGSCSFQVGSSGQSGTIKLGQMGSTMMACPSGMKEEQLILKALNIADRFVMTDDGMDLYSGPKKLLTLKAIQPQPVPAAG